MNRFTGLTKGSFAAVGFGVRPTTTTRPASTPTLTAGAGAPSASEPDGSVYLRTDGGADSTIYQRVSSAWVPIEGTGVSGAFDTISEVTSGAGVTIDGLLVKDGDAHFVDNDKSYFGDGDDIAIAWDATKLAVTQAATNSAIHLGVSGAGIDLNLFGDTVAADFTWDQSADSAIFGDNAKLVLGTGSDVTVAWDGTDLDVTCAADDSIVKFGNGTNSFDVWLYGNVATDYVLWDASASSLSLQGLASFGAVAFAGTATFNDGSLIQRAGAGTGTGDVIERIGKTTAEGMEVRVYEATVSPAAIETALFTVPANSVIDSVQANVETALTGGGTTVTFGIGVTGDVDAYGTAGLPTDLLTLNAKLNAIGTKSSGAGASIGVFSGPTQALKLIGAATGGTAAGDTALTVGSVRVVVRYRTLIDLANA